MAVTDTRMNADGKYALLVEYPSMRPYRCTGCTAYGDPCKRYATGRLDGSPVCTAHFKPVKPRSRPTPDQLEASRIRKLEGVQFGVKRRAEERAALCDLIGVTFLTDAEEEDCPVCWSAYTPTVASACGHRACPSCLCRMKEAALECARMCPLCRDVRFKRLVELAYSERVQYCPTDPGYM